MMKHLLTIVLCLTTLTGLAQEEKIKKSEWWNGNPSYAVPIREVNVTARRPMKEIGIQKTQLDTTILHENIALSMADILTFNTSIFVKQYGRATLSTVAFRGTSPSHTQVTWNGMRINSPMLGMTDFSMIPRKGLVSNRRPQGGPPTASPKQHPQGVCGIRKAAEPPTAAQWVAVGSEEPPDQAKRFRRPGGTA